MLKTRYKSVNSVKYILSLYREIYIYTDFNLELRIFIYFYWTIKRKYSTKTLCCVGTRHRDDHHHQPRSIPREVTGHRVSGAHGDGNDHRSGRLHREDHEPVSGDIYSTSVMFTSISYISQGLTHNALLHRAAGAFRRTCFTLMIIG